MFQLWIRDAHNHAMGQMNATSWGTDNFNLTIPAGNKFFNLWELDMFGYAMVYMTWQADTEELKGQMAFIPSSVGNPSVDQCSFSGSTESGTVTHFQCYFECHP